MTIGMIGVDHSGASLSLRERVAVSGERLDALVGLLCADPQVTEATVLSTCNRTELYLVADDPRPVLVRAIGYLATVSGVPADSLAGVMAQRIGNDAIRHLCAVAAGLRSLVIGEGQIATQVREAFAYAATQGTASTELQALGRAAVACGKRVRTETTLGTVDTSVSAVAVDHARSRLGRFHDRTALLIGAGRINEVGAQLLREAGIGTLIVVSRTREAAARLATAYGGRDADLSDLPQLLATVDLAIAATRATTPIIDAQTIRSRPPEQPLLLYDIAVPRNVDTAVASCPGVYLIDMDGLRALAPTSGELLPGFAAAEAIVDASVERYRSEAQTRRAVPLIAALRAHVDRQKESELARTLADLDHLSATDREAVESMAHRLVNRMFHHLATRLKAVALEPEADTYLAALAYLFDSEGAAHPSTVASDTDVLTASHVS